jgi:predicted O-methyltransferase YrrM
MVSLARLHRLLTLAASVGPNVAGVIAEFGVAAGGSAGLLGAVARRTGRQLWLFDSFEGLPEPGPRDGEEAHDYATGRNSGSLVPIEKCVGELEDVKRVLAYDFELDLGEIRFVKGWFQETRSKFPDLPIAFLHLDVDWHDSVATVLRDYFDLVSPGGIVVFDDYGWWRGCREAVDGFVEERSLQGFFVRDGQHAILRLPVCSDA